MSVLSDEITSGPLAAEIAPHIAIVNTDKIYEILSRKDIDALGVIQTADIRRYLFLNGLLLDIEKKNTAATEQAARALELFPFFTLSNTPDLAAFSALSDALIADSGLGFTATHKAELLALAATKISRLDQAGLYISEMDIRKEIFNEDGTRRI